MPNVHTHAPVPLAPASGPVHTIGDVCWPQSPLQVTLLGAHVCMGVGTWPVLLPTGQAKQAWAHTELQGPHPPSWARRAFKGGPQGCHLGMHMGQWRGAASRLNKAQSPLRITVVHSHVPMEPETPLRGSYRG